MAWVGSSFQRLYNWVTDKAANIPITASRMDDEMDGMATGITNCINKNGANSPTADLPMATQKHTNVGNATARAHYAAAGQVQDGSLTYAADTGAADAYVVTLSPAITSYATGMIVTFKAGNANTGASTINVNGVGAKTIKKLHDLDLTAGDIESGGVYQIQYDGTNFQLVSPVSNPTGPTVQVFTSSGTWTKPAGCQRVIVEVIGGGGGGGGGNAGASETAAAGGGGGGGYSREVLSASSLGATETVTVGAGGTGGTGSTASTGATGGTTSFGAYISAAGGTGGVGSNGQTTAIVGGSPGGGGAGSGGDFNVTGQPGTYGQHWSGTIAMGGTGGGSVFGGGASPVRENTAANAGNFYGGGGGGACGGGSARDGGNGADGVVIVTEFY